MTENDQKRKKYLKAVKWRLNLPKEIKERVMSDFSSSIQARRESGMEWEEIYGELGSPQKAAADLNEQMKEYAYRKSPWRFVFLAAGIYGAVKILPGLWVNLVYLAAMAFMEGRSVFFPQEAYSVGIIGGADGPTAIFLTTPVWMSYLIPAVLLVVGIVGYIRLSRCRKK